MVELLKDIRIVSFTHFLFGPMGVQTLADLGADVINVEPLGGSWQRSWGGADNRMVDGQSVLFLAVDRNKRSIAINLKHPKGVEITDRIIAGSDVLVTNYRPGVLEKLGFSYEALKKENPRLIYAAATGYGPDGPYVNRPGQDLLVQALSGLATITGTPESGPRTVGVSAVDHHGAALLALGIVAALFKRERTGEGCRIDVDLLSSALDLQMETLVCYLNGPRSESVVPPKYIGGWIYGAPYGIYATRDGHTAISLSSLKSLSEALNSQELRAFSDEEHYSKREEIAACIAKIMTAKSNSEWSAIFDKHGIWHSPVNDYESVIDDPQVRHKGSIADTRGATGTDIHLVSHPIRYDGEAPEIRLPPQPLGAQTVEIMDELGYSKDEIAEFEQQGVIRSHQGG
ncbi:MAG: CoA transferase [Desulfobacterales bacterium]|nr:MAG: CoA transferase [Desulfobacterales bacterium]